MTSDLKIKLLNVTAQIFAEAGYRGTTTRRIAQDAGINEVTIFRHYGSKDALIQAAMQHAWEAELPRLPEVPGDPHAELLEWSFAWYDHVHSRRALHRKLMGEFEEHPDILRPAQECTDVRILEGYLFALRDQGQMDASVVVRAAAGMLLGALHAAATFGDMLAEIPPRDEAVAPMVAIWLRGIGARGGAGAPADGHGAYAPADERTGGRADVGVSANA
ncbi:MAG: helix-turn-helix domain-containing protein [Gemmatimonadales bacterium]|nr:helix-turn-helix domain-containing protein [Gemmatimonadales bacterium]